MNTDNRIVTESNDNVRTPETARRVLVEKHLGLVRALAATTYRKISGTVEFDELVSLGTEGLLQAAARYDSESGTTFATYAYYRIHGAIYDGLRELGPIPRSLYSKRPSNDEWSSFGCEREVCMVSLEAHIAAGGELASDADAGADARIQASELSSFLLSAIEQLGERERRLIELYYFDEMSLAHAGDALGVSKSWASRLHNKSIDSLRNCIEALGQAGSAAAFSAAA